MNIYFNHYLESNVMVIKDDNIVASDYKINMVVRNNLDNLLKLNISCMDGNVEMIYDISGKQNIEEYCLKEKLCFNEIKLLFKGLIKLSKDINRYLLNINHIILDVNYIFINNNADNIYFCYYINNNTEFYEGLRKMVQRLVMITSHSDRQAVEFIYGILNICENGSFLFSDIEKYINNFEREKDNLCINEITEADTYIKENANIENKDDSYYNDKHICGKNKNTRNGVLGAISNIFNSKTKESIKNFSNDEYYFNEPINSECVAKNKIEYIEKINNNKTIAYKKDNMIYEDTMYIGNSVNSYNRKLCSISGDSDIIINDYPFIIGKNEVKADGIIKDNSISRIHAKIEIINDNCYIIEDLNSKNGTYVNDERINPYEKIIINIGDKIKFSGFEYFFM